MNVDEEINVEDLPLFEFGYMSNDQKLLEVDNEVDLEREQMKIEQERRVNAIPGDAKAFHVNMDGGAANHAPGHDSKGGDAINKAHTNDPMDTNVLEQKPREQPDDDPQPTLQPDDDPEHTSQLTRKVIPPYVPVKQVSIINGLGRRYMDPDTTCPKHHKAKLWHIVKHAGNRCQLCG